MLRAERVELIQQREAEKDSRDDIEEEQESEGECPEIAETPLQLSFQIVFVKLYFQLPLQPMRS